VSRGCRICLSNEAVAKGAWTAYEGTDAEQHHKVPTCSSCGCLRWEDVSKLIGLTKELRLRLLKRRVKYAETLKRLYPLVDWRKVAR
jgi:hypothetical protein